MVDKSSKRALWIAPLISSIREAAYALSAYVSPPSDWKFEPPFVSDAARIHPLTMIELGSGSGLVASGIIKTLEPRDLFIATDLPEVCKNLPVCHIQGLHLGIGLPATLSEYLFGNRW